MEKYFENEFAEYGIRDKIVTVEFKSGAVLDLAAAQFVTAARLSIHAGKRYPVFYDITGLRDSNKSGREYFAKHCPLFANAVALYAGGDVPMIIARFYLRLQFPTIPCELFSNKEKALSFLDSNH